MVKIDTYEDASERAKICWPVPTHPSGGRNRFLTNLRRLSGIRLCTVTPNAWKAVI